jgi:hypothetical protein
MRVASAVLALASLTLVAACADKAPTGNREFSIPVFATSGESDHFVAAPMNGDNERPNPVDTKARGNAVLWLSEDGTTLHYKLIVANIENVTQSHIHIADSEHAGPVVVFLFGFVAGGVTENGVLAEGDITQANLIARPAIGFGATMQELVAALRSGNAYVNVHTVAWPGGEIRGQVAETGPTQ